MCDKIEGIQYDLAKNLENSKHIQYENWLWPQLDRAYQKTVHIGRSWQGDKVTRAKT